MQLSTYSVYLETNHLPTVQEELMNPLKAQTFTKDKSVGGPITKPHRIKAPSFLLCSPPYPVYMVPVELPLSLDLEDPWLFISYSKQQESFGYFCTLDIPDSREFPMSPSQVLSSQRNRAVSMDHNMIMADLEFYCGFRQPSAVC